MKKLFLLSVLMLLPMLASADAVEIDGIWYNLITKDDINWAEVTSNPQHYKGSINIPDYVNYEDVDYVVKSIGTGAFASCWELNSVTLPKYLETIEFGSFLKCTSLSSIVIPDNVIQIGSQAFQDCLNLSSVTLPRSLKSVGSNAFYDCSRPININIPDLET